jgi:hypothetical protein
MKIMKLEQAILPKTCLEEEEEEDFSAITVASYPNGRSLEGVEEC